MSTNTSITNSVPKEKKPFPWYSDKAEIISFYCPNGIGESKITKRISNIMIAVTGDPHADTHKLISNKQIIAIIKYLGLPPDYTIEDIPFMSEKDM